MHSIIYQGLLISRTSTTPYSLMTDPRSIIASAEKLEKPQSGFMSLFSGGSSYRLEEASDLYVQAGNMYRLNKDFSSAGLQFVKAAELQKKLNNLNDVSNHLVEAYKCFKSVSPNDAILALKEAIHIFLTSNGQFRRAANFQMDLAELYESIDDVENASESYEKAGDYFSTDHAPSLSNKAYLKCADLNALKGNYLKARDHYDTVIKNSLGNALTKWSLKDYFFKSVLCILCADDTVEAGKRMEKYADEEPSWPSTREYKLIQEIMEAIENGDTQAFSDKVYEYDQFSKLDKLKTQLLLKIKNSVVEQDEDDLT